MDCLSSIHCDYAFEGCIQQFEGCRDYQTDAENEVTRRNETLTSTVRNKSFEQLNSTTNYEFMSCCLREDRGASGTCDTDITYVIRYHHVLGYTEPDDFPPT
jgi:hypothetical protein